MAKRIKHVVSGVWHIWAHQTYAQYGRDDNWARNASDNRSFNNEAASSYRTVIAIRHLVTQGKGKKAVQVPVILLDECQYSVTTAKMKSELKQSIPGDMLWFEVPEVGHTSYNSEPYLTEFHHAKNVRYFHNQIAIYLGKAIRARANKQQHERHVLSLMESLKGYVEIFGLSKKLVPDSANLDELKTRQVALDKAETERVKQANAKARKDAQDAIAGWLNHTGASVPYNVQEAYLRVGRNSYGTTQLEDMAQTSRHADVPMRHIARILPLIIRAVKSEKLFYPDSAMRLGHYQLNSISADGTIKVGCHIFLKSEILRFAKIVQDWIDATGYNRHKDVEPEA